MTTLLTRRARERRAAALLATLARYAATAEAQMARAVDRLDAVRALIWLEIRIHVAHAVARLRAWVEGGR
jgi:hypothetical protein